MSRKLSASGQLALVRLRGIHQVVGGTGRQSLRHGKLLVTPALAKEGLKRSLRLTITQMYPVPALVAGSDLIATLMLGVVETGGWSDRLEILDPPIELAPCPYVMSWHRRNDTHPAQRWLRSCVQTAASHK